MMLYKPFRQVQELLGDHDTFAAAYAEFLQSSNVPPSLEDDIQRLEQSSQWSTDDDSTQVWLHVFVHTANNYLITVVFMTTGTRWKYPATC